MIELHSVFDLIDSYLETGSSLSLKRLKSLFHFYYIDHKDSFSSYNIDSYDAKSRQSLLKIINKLDIKRSFFPKGIGKLTIEEVFFELCKITDDPLTINVTEVFEREQSKKRLIMITAGVFSGVIFLGLLTNKFFQNFLEETISLIISSANAIPIIGLLINTCVTLAHLWMIIDDQKVNKASRLREALFMVAHFFCNVLAYSLILVGSSNISLIGFLFLMSSVVMVGHHLVSLTKKIQQLTAQNKDAQEDSPQIIQSKIRLRFGYEKQRNELITDLVAAGLMVGIVAISSFVPGGTIVVISCLMAIALLNITRMIVNKIIKDKSERKLELALRSSFQNLPISLDGPALGHRLEDIFPKSQYVISRLTSILPVSSQVNTQQEDVFQGTTKTFFENKLSDSKKITQGNEKDGDILLRV